MEIRIRTAEEIAADRVTVEVNGARLYTSAEVAHAQYTEAEMVAQGLERKISKLERELALVTRERNTAVESLTARDAELNEVSPDRDHQVFDRNRVRAKRAEGRVKQLERELALVTRERDTAVESLTARDAELIRGQSVRPDLKEAREALENRVQELEKLLAQETSRAGWARDRADRAEKRADMFRTQAYRENDRCAALKERVEQLEKSLADARQGTVDRTVERNTAGEEVEALKRHVRELEQSIEARSRLLSTATTALRKISVEVAVLDHNTPSFSYTDDVIENIRDLASPWADTSQA
jgi:chromosome segregation ATPase